MARISVLAATLAFLLFESAASAQECHPHGGAPIVTVTGAAKSNRGGISPLDQFAAHQEMKFDHAFALTADDLAALPQQTLAMVLPYDKKQHVFSGPYLSAVLDAAGAGHGGLVAHGIDGYRMEFSAAELAALHPILSLCHDGNMHGVGDFAPAFVVFKPANGSTPNDDEFSKMIWGVYLIDGVTP